MAGLRALLAAAALLSAGPAGADPVARWPAYVADASARFGIPEPWIRRVMRAESGGRTVMAGRPIVSRKGAMGLMQLMPATWREVRARLGLGQDPQDPRDNILAGAFYLRVLYDRFGYPGLFAAYNAGPARYSDHLIRGRHLPAETIAYLANVTSGDGAAIASAARPLVPPPSSILFAVAPRRAEAPTDAPSPPLRIGASLFAPVSTQTAARP